MEVLFPPTGGQTFTDVSTYLLNNSAAPVAGANFAVEWADIDQGLGANPQYVWTSVDDEIQPWSAAGKKVNLVLWAVSDNTSNTATPQYVWNSLPSGETATCNGEQIPDYFDATNFQTPYLAFINAALQKYGSNSNIGYIRIGLGRGGETFPGRGFSPTGTDLCSLAVLGWMPNSSLGWSQNWITYLTSMLTQEHAFNTSGKPLTVGLVGGGSGSGSQSIPDAVAAVAVGFKIGFGSQGLQASDISNYPNCTSDWCNLFGQYTKQVPLELQTVGPSCPAGVNQCGSNQDENATGSLVQLLPFATGHDVNILELYYQDWLVAYDPNNPLNSQYGSAYATAIQNAASGR